jgi:hypothetical protein
MSAPRFAETFCSQCGDSFGPGDSGYSHCHDHSPHRERLAAAAPAMLAALQEVSDYLDGLVDVVDGDYGQPAPNKAMTLKQEVDEAIALAEGRS